MPKFEYKAVPSPRRTKRIKGVKGNDNLFAETLSASINEMAADGWQYLRAESLPVDEKPGLLKSRVETYHSLLIFCRELPDEPAEAVTAPPVMVAPVPKAEVSQPAPEPIAPTGEPAPEPLVASPAELDEPQQEPADREPKLTRVKPHHRAAAEADTIDSKDKPA